MPINLVATEDGRTLLAVTGMRLCERDLQVIVDRLSDITVTEHRDGMLEILATPITFIGQGGTVTSLAEVKDSSANLILHSVCQCFLSFELCLFSEKHLFHYYAPF